MSNGGTVVIGAGPGGPGLRGRAAAQRRAGGGARARRRRRRLVARALRPAAPEHEPLVLEAPGRRATRRGTGIFPSRDEVVALPRGLRARQRPRRAPAARSVERIDRDGAGLGRAHVGRRRRGRAGGRRGRLRAHAVRPGLAGPRALPRRRCCTPPSTATPSPTAAATCSWSARAARAWRSPTTSPRAGRGGSASRCAPRRTSSSRSPIGPVFALALMRVRPQRADRVVQLRALQGDRRPHRVRPAGARGGDVQPPAPPRRRAGDRRQGRRSRRSASGASRSSPASSRSTRPASRLADGARIEPDAVIAATGYRRGLEPHGRPPRRARRPGRAARVAAEAAAPGLRFVGYVHIPAQLRYAGSEGKRAAKAIAAELRAQRGTPRAAGARRSDRPPSTASRAGPARPGGRPR